MKMILCKLNKSIDYKIQIHLTFEKENGRKILNKSIKYVQHEKKNTKIQTDICVFLIFHWQDFSTLQYFKTSYSSCISIRILQDNKLLSTKKICLNWIKFVY